MNEIAIHKIYKSIIALLTYLEAIIGDKENFYIVRKQLLDIGNDVKRLGDNNGKFNS